MRYALARSILQRMPPCWAEDASPLRLAYAKQLLENNLIEEVKPGEYRATIAGTEYALCDPICYRAGAIEKILRFTIEEIDLEYLRFIENAWEKCGECKKRTDEELQQMLGQPCTPMAPSL